MNLTSQGYIKEESPSRYKRKLSDLASIQDILFQRYRGIITGILTRLGYPDGLPAWTNAKLLCYFTFAERACHPRTVSYSWATSKQPHFTGNGTANTSTECSANANPLHSAEPYCHGFYCRKFKPSLAFSPRSLIYFEYHWSFFFFLKSFICPGSLKIHHSEAWVMDIISLA